MTKHPIRRLACTAGAGAMLAGASAGIAVALATASTSHHPSAAKTIEVLQGNGIAQARFGERARVATERLQALLGRSPTRSYRRINACGLDHFTAWSGLIVFFRRDRFVGYTYSAHSSTTRQRTLATASGLRVGDTLAKARRLYGHKLRTTLAQGGAYSVKTRSGTIEGFLANAPPISARSTIRTIEAGDLGCPAVRP